MTAGVFKRQDSNFGEMYIYNYLLSVIVVKVPTDSETSPRTQTTVSALFGDRLMASIQVVTTDKTTIATFPAFQDDLLSASPLVIRPQIRVNVVKLIYD